MENFKRKKVIKANNLPYKLPIWASFTAWLALDHWNAPQWVYGAVGLFFLIVWINSIVGMVTQESIDLVNNEPKK